MSDDTESVLVQLQIEIDALRRDLEALRRRVEDGDAAPEEAEPS